MTEKEELLSTNRISSTQHTGGKSIQARSDAAGMCAQHLKRCNIYSLPVFFFLFCLIKAVIKPFVVGPFVLRLR